MGNCLYHLHRVEEALEKYKRALYINPKNFAALHG
jgi:tetratricopeptide (TPR) repeat protein